MTQSDKSIGKVHANPSFRWIGLVTGLVILAVLAGCSRTQPGADANEDKSKTPTAVAVQPTSTVAPTLEPRPFGEFSLGWKGFNPVSCAVVEETNAFQLDKLDAGKFIYFVSPFEATDVSNAIKWQVIRPDGSKAYDATSTIYADENHCFWQALMLAGEDPGEYKLQITDWKDTVTSLDFTLE